MQEIRLELDFVHTLIKPSHGWDLGMMKQHQEEEEQGRLTQQAAMTDEPRGGGGR